jgi:hypothetical protein
LSFPGSERERLNNIIEFGCIEVGKKQWQRFRQIEKSFRREHQPSEIDCTCKIDLSDDTYQQAVAGAQQLKVTIRDIHGMVGGYACLARFIREFERKHGADAQVRLATNFVFEARDNKGMSYSDLAVLAAIYSKIGASRKPVKITQQEIWLRAHGLKSARVFRAEMNRTKILITLRQVRSIIERLHTRNFFARITYARRQTYYSHRLTSTALSQQVFTTKIQRHIARQARIRANADLTKRIQAERRRLAGPNATDTATNAPL